MIPDSTALAASLVKVGADALRDARFVDPDDDTLPRFHDKDQRPEGNIQHWTKPDAAAGPVIAAALRALAEALESERRDYASTTRLNRLADLVTGLGGGS